jgi:hypothetical protein
MSTKRVIRLLSVGALVPLLLSSCDSSNTFDPFEDAVGTYDLSVYAGRSLPATFTCQPGECGMTNGGTFVANSGTLVLDDDGTFLETNHYTQTPTGGSPQQSTFVSSGVYDIVGDNEIQLFAPAQNGLGARTLNATIEYGGPFVTIHYEEDGEDYEYRRD